MLNLVDIRKFFEGEITAENFVGYVFGLTFHEIAVLKFMMQHVEEITVGEIVKGMNKKDRVHISKTLKKLIEVAAVQREKKSEDGKPGYHYVYKTLNIEQLKQLALDRVDAWYEIIRPKITLLEAFFAKEDREEEN